MVSIQNLSIMIDDFYILREVSFDIKKSEIFGILGESGSGKSVLVKELAGLNRFPLKRTAGEISLPQQYKSAMIFQHPSSALNPVMTIGAQLIETIMLSGKKKLHKKDAEKKASELLELAGIENAADRLHAYPHQLSGGMNQRIMIALALCLSPTVLFADEPTTALDVITQAQILKLIKNLSISKQFTTVFVTHDISLIERIADRVMVLYAGEIMEILDGSALMNGRLRHPYTKALKNCVPYINKNKDEKLSVIPGNIAKNSEEYDSKCIFFERCSYAKPICKEKKPIFSDNIKCHFHDI